METKTQHIIYMLIGAIVGLFLGILAFLLVFRFWGHLFQDRAPLLLLAVLVLVVGGLTAGAYSVQAVIFRLERSKRKKERKSRKNKRRR
ncbi:MAG: hypothetical protein AB7W28_04510 [Armatimonadota bacterium]